MVKGTHRQEPAKSRRKRILLPIFVSLVLGVTSLSGTFRPAAAQGIPELLNRVKPSVGFVFVSGDQLQGSGSGFVVDASGLVVTALHLVEDASQVSVAFPGGHPQQADVVGFDTDNDLALLRIGQSNLSPLGLGDSDALKAGEEVIVIGYPFGDRLGTYDVTVTRGIISAIRPQTGPRKLPPIQVDAAMNPGVSGGPVLNMSGQVIGIAVSGLSRASAVNFAGPVNAAKALLAKYLDARASSVALTLPLTSVTPVVLSYKSGGIGGGGHETKLGVSCIEPPQGARTISRVRAVLNAGTLSVLTWLSLGGEASVDSPNSFARLRAIGQTVTPKPVKVSLPADKVCLNYEALNPMALFPFGATFEVKYGLDYRISPASDSAKLPDDAAIAAIKAKVVATVRKQLLDLYQREGLDAVLAKLRTPATGSDVVSQTIYAERQRLLDAYEFEGRDGLLAELRK